jgi:hypothetical protein
MFVYDTIRFPPLNICEKMSVKKWLQLNLYKKKIEQRQQKAHITAFQTMFSVEMMSSMLFRRMQTISKCLKVDDYVFVSTVVKLIFFSDFFFFFWWQFFSINKTVSRYKELEIHYIDVRFQNVVCQKQS